MSRAAEPGRLRRVKAELQDKIDAKENFYKEEDYEAAAEMTEAWRQDVAAEAAGEAAAGEASNCEASAESENVGELQGDTELVEGVGYCPDYVE